MQARISARCRQNLAQLRHTCQDTALTVLDVEAGWTALLRLPAVHDLDDAGWALHLLRRGHILTQPGHLFDLGDPPRLALSLLTPEPEFTAACARLPDLVARVIDHGP
jgi:alanine-synthesizing transaminase